MKSNSMAIFAILTALTVNSLLRAADAVPAKIASTTQHAKDEAAIRAAGAAFIEAYNVRDAKKLAALWSPEAIYTDLLTGEETVGAHGD